MARARSSAVRRASRASTSAEREVAKRVGGGVADLGVGLVVDGLVLGDGELLLGGLQREQGVGPAGLDGVAAALEPGRLGLGGAGGLLQQAEPGGAGGALLLGVAAGPPRLLDVGLPGGLLGAGALQSRAQAGQLLLDGLAALVGLVDGGLHVQRAGGGAGAAGGAERAEHVAAAGDGGQRRIGLHEPNGRGEIGDDHDAAQERVHGRDGRPGSAHGLGGPAAPDRADGRFVEPGSRAQCRVVRDEQGGAARVLRRAAAPARSARPPARRRPARRPARPVRRRRRCGRPARR